MKLSRKRSRRTARRPSAEQQKGAPPPCFGRWGALLLVRGGPPPCSNTCTDRTLSGVRTPPSDRDTDRESYPRGHRGRRRRLHRTNPLPRRHRHVRHPQRWRGQATGHVHSRTGFRARSTIHRGDPPRGLKLHDDVVGALTEITISPHGDRSYPRSISSFWSVATADPWSPHINRVRPGSGRPSHTCSRSPVVACPENTFTRNRCRHSGPRTGGRAHPVPGSPRAGHPTLEQPQPGRSRGVGTRSGGCCFVNDVGLVRPHSGGPHLTGAVSCGLQVRHP